METEATPPTFVPASERLRRHRRRIGRVLLWLLVVPAVVTFVLSHAAMAFDDFEQQAVLRLDHFHRQDRTLLGERLRNEGTPMEEIDRQLAALDLRHEQARRAEESVLGPLLVPFIMLAWTVSFFSVSYGVIVLGVAMPRYAYRLAMRDRMHRRLIDRGYEWATRDDAEWVLLEEPRFAWSLPRVEETCVLPGIHSNVDGLVAYVRRQRDWKFERTSP